MSVGQQNGGKANQGQRASGGAEQPADLNALKEDVSQVADVALERGRQFVDSARAQATGYVDQRKGDLAQSVADLANALREASKPFEDRPNIRAFVDNAAEGLEQLADTVRERSVAEIYADVEDILRRRPAAVAVATLAAGFLISRFIRASADNLRVADAQRRRAGGGGVRPSSGSATRSATVRI
jgi:hypothetical protein